MEKIIQTLIDSWTKGVDTYTHNGSTWLIFTESKQWVIELTDSKTLWYNYNFFKQIFEFTSLDVVENQQYITKWVEDNIINKELTYATLFRDARDRKQQFEDALENGVRHTEDMVTNIFVDDTLENGVKSTISTLRRTLLGVDDIIQNGIKETRLEMNITEGEVDDIIQDGVKYTFPNSEMGTSDDVEDTIQNGVIYTFGDNHHKHHFVDNIIQNGVRDTQSNPYENKSWIDGVIKKGVRHTLNTEYMPTSMVEDIIQSGVKHTEYGDWLDGDERLDDIVENGVKKTSLKRGTRPFMVKDTIKNGVKETNPVDVMKFFDNKMEDALQNGIKETKTPGNGDITSYVDWLKDNKTSGYQGMVEDVIDNGEKINGTYVGGQRQSEKCKSVVEYGTKNPTD